MTGQSTYVEWLVRLLAFSAGVASTVVGSWVSSKIRVYHDNRKAHLDDLKQRVLTPLRDGLQQRFRPFVFHLMPLVSVQTGATTHFDERAKATEEPIEEEGDVLLAPFPSSVVFGSLDPALLEDATKKHFSTQMEQVNKFIIRWSAYAGECHSWVMKIAQQILTRSGLPAFSPRYTGPGLRPYVMHLRLAVFVYKRLFRHPAPALRPAQMETHWTLNGEGRMAALGSKEQMDILVVQIDKLLESEEATARTLRDKGAELQNSFQELTPKLDYAIAARRLRKRCDLVTFL